MKRWLILGFALPLLCCSTIPYQESKPLNDSFEVAMFAVERAVRQKGYLGRAEKLMAETRGGECQFQSPWKIRLQPMQSLGSLSRGIRRRVEGILKMHEGKYVVKLAVRREINTDIERPLDEKRASWSSTGFDGLEAKILLKNIEYFLLE